MTPCANCGKPSRTMVRDVPGGAVLWSCVPCQVEVRAVVLERDGMAENDGRLPPKPKPPKASP